jgi:hypothetical protein
VWESLLEAWRKGAVVWFVGGAALCDPMSTLAAGVHAWAQVAEQVAGCSLSRPVECERSARSTRGIVVPDRAVDEQTGDPWRRWHMARPGNGEVQ